MSKSRGRRHKWKRSGEWATCINCGLKVEAKRVRRGGLPTCDEVLNSEAHPISHVERLGNYFQEYLVSYRKGCELFGVWWKLFTFSMISFSVIFFLVAIVLVLLYLV